MSAAVHDYSPIEEENKSTPANPEQTPTDDLYKAGHFSKQTAQQVFNAVVANDVKALEALLTQDGKEFELTTLRDLQGYTPLSLSAFKNQESTFMVLFKHVLSTKKSELKQWVDAQNFEGFTALHFGSFHGNYPIIKELVEIANANINLVNKSGCSVLHLAAQGNRAVSIYYFAVKHGMDLNQRDSRQSTPLHWACFTKSEVAQNYILSVPGVDIDAKEENQFTPLHFAVQSVEALQSTRPVKALLLRGANKSLRDNKGRTPLGLMSQTLLAPLRNDLRSILREPWFFECIMIRAPVIKLEPNHKTQILFWALNIITLFTLWFILFPNHPAWYYAVSSSMIGIKMFIPYVMATRKDPGVLKPDPQLDFIDLLQKFDANELCADCKVIRTPRSRHCQVCNVCVERFDHHCPWINNCVGVNNHNNYLFFVTYAWIYALLVMCIAMDCLGRGASKDPSRNPLGALCFAGECNAAPLFLGLGFFELIVSTVFFFPVTQASNEFTDLS